MWGPQDAVGTPGQCGHCCKGAELRSQSAAAPSPLQKTWAETPSQLCHLCLWGRGACPQGCGRSPPPGSPSVSYKRLWRHSPRDMATLGLVVEPQGSGFDSHRICGTEGPFGRPRLERNAHPGRSAGRFLAAPFPINRDGGEPGPGCHCCPQTKSIGTLQFSLGGSFCAHGRSS